MRINRRNIDVTSNSIIILIMLPTLLKSYISYIHKSGVGCSGAELYVQALRPQHMLWVGGGSRRLIFNDRLKDNTYLVYLVDSRVN